MRDVVEEKQVQWILSYVQGKLVDMWKKNIIEVLESRSLSYTIIEKFLSDLKKEFRDGDNETMKMAELKKVKQGSKTIEEFV